MSTSLENRIAALEAQHAGPVRIFVTRDGGETYTSNGETFTRAELDARYAGEDATVFRVVYDDQAVAQ